MSTSINNLILGQRVFEIAAMSCSLVTASYSNVSGAVSASTALSWFCSGSDGMNHSGTLTYHTSFLSQSVSGSASFLLRDICTHICHVLIESVDTGSLMAGDCFIR